MLNYHNKISSVPKEATRHQTPLTSATTLSMTICPRPTRPSLTKSRMLTKRTKDWILQSWVTVRTLKMRSHKCWWNRLLSTLITSIANRAKSTCRCFGKLDQRVSQDWQKYNRRCCGRTPNFLEYIRTTSWYTSWQDSAPESQSSTHLKLSLTLRY